MGRKKIAVIGAGGRTGTMFAFELKKEIDVLGLAKKREEELVREKRLYVKRGGQDPLLFDVKVIRDYQVEKENFFDFVFLATKNPVLPPIEYYYQKLKEKKPLLLISQNGISAINDAKKALEKIYGEKVEDVRLVRLVLFNPIDRKEKENRITVKYSLPLKIAVSKASGRGDIEDIVEIFKNSGFEIEQFGPEDAGNMEFSKLFLNLIGMASASRGLSVKEGFINAKVLREEISVLREYIRAVKKNKGRFLNFKRYPVKTLSTLFSLIPIPILALLKNIIAEIVSKGREGKPKDLDEIDYYNKAVIDLGKKTGVKTPVNQEIYNRVSDR